MKHIINCLQQEKEITWKYSKWKGAEVQTRDNTGSSLPRVSSLLSLCDVSWEKVKLRVNRKANKLN